MGGDIQRRDISVMIGGLTSMNGLDWSQVFNAHLELMELFFVFNLNHLAPKLLGPGLPYSERA